MKNKSQNNKQIHQSLLAVFFILIPLSAMGWTQTKTIVGSDVVGNDRFGSSVAVDGNTAVVGAPQKNDELVCGASTTCSTGGVYVFERHQGGTDRWGEVAKLRPSDLAIGDSFGLAIAISGNTIVVGAPRADSLSSCAGNASCNSGAVYVFERNASNRDQWTQVAKLIGSNVAAGDLFGSAVAISGDFIVVGAPMHDANNGAAYIFSRHVGGRNAWGEIHAQLSVNANSKESIGESVSVRGNVFVVGAPHANTSGPKTGALYILELASTGVWSTQKIDGGELPNSAEFGRSAAVYGSYVLAGAPGVGAGQVQIFRKATDRWERVKAVVPKTGAAGDLFGFSIALYGDQLSVGAPRNKSNGVNTGAAFIFSENDGGMGNWGEVKKLVASEAGNNSSFGFSLGMADNALVVGAYFEAGIAGFATIYQQHASAAPTDIQLTPASVNENAVAGTKIGKLTAIDANSSDTHQFVLLNSNSIPFVINGDIVTLTGSLNYELNSSYTMRVRVTDSSGLSFEKDVKVAINDVNEKPLGFTLSNTSVYENAEVNTVVGNFTVTDPDVSDVFSFKIITQNPNIFAIGGIDGKSLVTNGSPIDYEKLTLDSINPVGVLVEVTDSGGNSLRKSFAISVINVNERPIGITVSRTTVPENSPLGTLVGRITVSDPDVGDTHSITLTNGQNIPFSISGFDIVVAGTLDYETLNRYSLSLKITDSANNSFLTTSNVDVTNVNEKPTAIKLDSLSVDENSLTGTVIGQLTVIDSDKSDQHQFTIVDDASGAFSLDGDKLIVANAQLFDFELNASLTIRVRASDKGGLAIEQVFEIKINDVFEPPIIVDLPDLKILNTIPVAVIGHPYTAAINIVNGTPPYEYKWSGSVPGLIFDGDRIVGNPTTLGEFSVSLLVADSSVVPISKSFEILVSVNPEQLTIKTESVANAIVGASYSVQMHVSGGVAPYFWSAASELPSGLELLKTGLISGKAAQSGTFSFDILVNDANQNVAAKHFEMTIYDSGLVDLTPALPNARLGQEYKAPIIVSGGNKPYDCVVVNGELPPGIDMASCRLTGEARARGDYSFEVQVTDNGAPIVGAQFIRSIKVIDPRETLANAFSAENVSRVTELEHWSKVRPGGAFLDEANTGMATDAFGNHYIVGYAYNGNSYEMHTLKYDADGNILWHQVYDSGNHDYVYGISVSPDQDVYIGGYQLQGNRYLGALIKYDSQGVLQWKKVHATSSLVTTFYSIVSDSTGVYVAGEMYNGHDFDAIVAKYDAAGNLLWQHKRATDTNDTTYSMDAIRCTDQVAICHLFVGGATGVGARTGWVQKLDPTTGALLASNVDLNKSDVKALIIGGGNVFIGGNGVNLGWSLYKLDSDLNLVWQSEYKENQARGFRGIALDQNQFLYAAGYGRNERGEDALVVAFNRDGVTIATHVIDKGRNERANSILVDANQKLVVSGHSYNSSESVLLMEVIDY